MSNVYLKAWHGGLGDALQFSTLPEEFSKQQGRKTYILEDAPFRNSGIYDLVWGQNPFVLGKRKGTWNAGDLPEIPYRKDGFLDINGTGNMISNWEKFHGLKPKNKYPKIYYHPEKHDDMRDIFIVDFSSTTVSDDPVKLSEILEILRKEYSDKKFISVEFSDINVKKCFNNDIKFDGYIEVENIFRYCDLISSVYGYVSLHSGGTHLSSALKEYSPNLKSICILSKEWYNEHEVLDNHFLFDNIKYLKY